MKQTEIEDMELLVEKLEGIISVKFIADNDGELEEIHVLSDKVKSPKQLSRDIQSAISASTGFNIKHKIISIAQIDENPILKDAQMRLKIAGLDISYSKNEFIASVTLEIEGQTYNGTAKNMFAVGSRSAEVATATVGAINDYLKNQIFYIYNVQKLKIGIYNASVVAVSYFDSGHNEKLLIGTSIIKEDEYYSAIKATLDAINRTLTQFSVSE